MSKQMKVWVGLGSFLATFTILGAFVCAPYLLAMASSGEGGATCPFGGTRDKSPKIADQARDAQAALLRGHGRAKHTRLFGLTLSASRREDIDKWAQARTLTCSAQKNGRALDCAARYPGTIDQAFSEARAIHILLELDRNKTLKNMKVLADFPNAGAAAHYFQGKIRETIEQIGVPHEIAGEASDAYLGSGIFRQARALFHTENLFARLSATHLSAGHFTIVHALQDLTSS